MPRKKQTITILEVARLAGVSTASVSKVFNHVQGVSKKTRAAVLAAAGQLEYLPNNAARSLRAMRSHTIGVITDDMEGVFTTSLRRGVDDACRERDFSVFLTNSYGDMDRERINIEVLQARQVDGIILMSGYNPSRRNLPAAAMNVPCVYLYQYPEQDFYPSVLPDDVQGGYLGTTALIDLGHQRIGLLNGPASYESTFLRYEGYQTALNDHGLVFDPHLVRAGEWHQQSGYDQAMSLMRLKQPPSALFCLSDLLALGAAEALSQLHVSVPEDVSLLGYDDRFFAAHARPPLSTVALPLVEMGRQAGVELLDMILGVREYSGMNRIPCRLVERLSTGPVKCHERVS